MTTGNRTDEFIRIESETSQLLDELTKLRMESESYTTSRQALTEVVRDVHSLADRLSNIATGIGNAATALREIGTPALLDGQRNLDGRINSLSHDVQMMDTKIDSARHQIKEQADAVRDQRESDRQFMEQRFSAAHQQVQGLARQAQIGAGALLVAIIVATLLLLIV